MDESTMFTAGLTLTDGRVRTVDVERLDTDGITYRTEEGAGSVAWSEVKAVMLATTDHMLETAGYMFEVSELLDEQERRQPYDAAAMRQKALGLLAQVAPRVCPLGPGCPLAASPPPDGVA